MRRRSVVILAACVVGVLVLAGVGYEFRYIIASRLHLAVGENEAAVGLSRVRDVPLNGSASRFDYQSMDTDRGLLWITHMGANEVVAYDVRAGKVKGYVPGIATPTGVLAIPEIGRAYVSAAGSQQVAVIDEDSMQIIARVDAGQFPDGLAYDPGTHRLFVSDESGGADTVIDIRSNTRVGSIDLGGEAGNTQYDAAGKQIVAAAQGRGQLALIDPASMSVKSYLDVPGCRGPHGFYVDSPARLAYVSCEDKAKLVVVNLQSGAVGASFDVGDVPDVLAFDTSSHRLYVASESGVVATFAAGGGSLAKLGEAYLAPAAHTISVDPATHLVYVPLEDVEGHPELRVLEGA